MAIHLRCSCGYQKELPQFYAGKNVRCPSCASVISLPSAEIFDIEVDTVTPSLAKSESRVDVVTPPLRIDEVASHLTASSPERKKAHPGSASLAAHAGANLGQDAPPPLPQAREMASPSIFNEKPSRRDPCCFVGNFTLLFGLLITAIVPNPKVAIAFTAIYSVVTLITIISRKREGRLGFFPLLILAAFLFLGFKQVKAFDCGSASACPYSACESDIKDDAGKTLEVIDAAIDQYGEDQLIASPRQTLKMVNPTWVYNNLSDNAVISAYQAKGVSVLEIYPDGKHGSSPRHYSARIYDGVVKEFAFGEGGFQSACSSSCGVDRWRVTE